MLRIFYVVAVHVRSHLLCRYCVGISGLFSQIRFIILFRLLQTQLSVPIVSYRPNNAPSRI